jgi:hypothetical protein
MATILSEREFDISLCVMPDEGTPFDTIEIHPCMVVGMIDSVEMIEECDEDKAEFWGIYVHIPEHGLECIADAATKQTAEALKTLLLTVGKNLMRDDL